MAPEYATSGKLSEKADVYSYGVILLELITGRKPVDTSQPLGDESLVEWVSASSCVKIGFLKVVECSLTTFDFKLFSGKALVESSNRK